MLSKQWENAVNKVIERTRISNIITDFREKAKMNAPNLMTERVKDIISTLCQSCILARPITAVEEKILPRQPEYPVRNAILHGEHTFHQR